ncbi:aldehyde dehydrogenase [Uncinocarpus reesii 1704]|uniref:aldehyde dehydrogenase (NAD(+)) n=1 Tax=Uncinocarpus reesii (strain UAMH 1704) TaxID=336963 RepID=C4JPV4_UNCRE|nr:aldehyde dehydrogenase [Uncinocarpus reesii 1704]EEP79751.1 aldehyde dehydrogenase [Uncinocarpus reesii 1704]
MATKTVTLKGVEGRSIEIPTGLFINNEFVPSLTGNTLETTNPANGELLATVAAASEKDIDTAVQSAKNAFHTTWKATPATTRQSLMLKLADLIERDGDVLATLEALDGGILLSGSKMMHIPHSAAALRYFAGWADKIDGKSLVIPDGMAYTHREPLGLSELIREAGFPAGVVNIVTGLGPVAGRALSEHMEVRKIAFTGSTLTGRAILKAAASSNLKKVSLELGGKGPTIIFDDADLENAVFWASTAITAHNGQICAAGSRIYVQEGIYDKFIAAFTAASSKAIAGDPLLSTTTKGPIVSAGQHSKIMGYIKKGQEEGARLLHGGGQPANGYIENTAFVDVQEDMTIMKEEIFGPVAAISKFKTESEVIQKANNTEYGLSSAIFTDNVSRADRVSRALECGQVTVNAWAMMHPNVPFGGTKMSGFGKDLGEESLDGWTTTKAIKYNILPETPGRP